MSDSSSSSKITTHSELRWIDEEPINQLTRPPLDEFEVIGQKTIGDTVFKKCRENFLVPLGLAATVGCLTLGLINFRRGNGPNQQFYMRGRVGAQAFTLAAMAISMYFTNKKRHEAATK